MQRHRVRARLGAAGALVGLLALSPAWATEPQPQQKTNGSNQPVHTTTLRAAAKQQTDLTKDRVRGVQARVPMDQAEATDLAADDTVAPRLQPAGDDVSR